MADLKPCPFCGIALIANNNQRDFYVQRYGTHYRHPINGCYLSDDEVSPGQVKYWNRRATDGVLASVPPSPEEVARVLKNDGNGSPCCPLCGWDDPHEHTPREITIYRNGVKWGQRNGTEPWPGNDYPSPAQDAGDDASGAGKVGWPRAYQHHEHRAGQSNPDRADDQRARGSDGLPGGSEVPPQDVAGVEGGDA